MTLVTMRRQWVILKFTMVTFNAHWITTSKTILRIGVIHKFAGGTFDDVHD